MSSATPLPVSSQNPFVIAQTYPLELKTPKTLLSDVALATPTPMEIDSEFPTQQPMNNQGPFSMSYGAKSYGVYKF